MRPELLKKYAAPVPRYTSYPTAPHFSGAIGPATYGEWLAALVDGQRLSLYVHIPFCDQLCWYCGCTTKITQRYEPIARYLEALLAEIDAVGGKLRGRHAVEHIHWGGGSPSILSPADITRLAGRLRSAFDVPADAEFAVEVDPRGLDPDRVAAFAEAGVSRISIGVQDFDPRVQRAINREQSFELTRSVVDGFRAAGVKSINIDLVYGLPYQTRASLDDTIQQVISLAPDRIALFGYAHLPERITHQRLIPDESLPDAKERYAQSGRAGRRLLEAGYVKIGLDHFAKPTDTLATRPVRRNFQGYTSDAAPVLIGLGASSIGRLPQGYVQNAVAMAEYERRIADAGLATARGHAMSVDDEARAFAIERLMCDFRFPGDELVSRFGPAAGPVLEDAAMLVESDRDGIVEQVRGSRDFLVSEQGRMFVRSIAACFDAYLGTREVRHSLGV
jgi:oxygen-independent coproporphyrinogen-3 oxidase